MTRCGAFDKNRKRAHPRDAFKAREGNFLAVPEGNP